MEVVAMSTVKIRFGIPKWEENVGKIINIKNCLQNNCHL
uniref:Uncharacterized protein n=1 Tax=Anguilla anguilla TaxID=7936 RepID=A0A0E9S1T2_ANGAN